MSRFTRFFANAYEQGWSFMKPGKSGTTPQGYVGSQDSVDVSPAGGTPPFQPFEGMRMLLARALGATPGGWGGAGQRVSGIDIRPAPYDTADSAFRSGLDTQPTEPGHEKSVVSASRVVQFLLSRFDPLNGITPRRLHEYLAQWNLGFLRWQALLWSMMRERDDQIKSVEAKRIFAVSRLNWEIVAEDDSPESEEHKEALEAFYNNLTVEDVLNANQQGGVHMLIRQMMTCIGYKFAVHEIVWMPDIDPVTQEPVLTARLRFVPIWFFENRTGVLRYLPYELALDGVPLDAGGWLVTVGDGLLVASSIAYLYKQLGLKAWVNYVDKFNIPFMHGKTPAAANSVEWNQFINALQNMRADGAMITNLGAEVEFLNPGAGTNNPQEQLTDRMDRAHARLWRGGDLSTMSRGSNGAGALPQMQQEDELAADDAIKCSEACNFYIDRYVGLYLYGSKVKMKAHFRIVPPLNVDTAKEIAVDQFLVSMGAKLGMKDAMARYGRRTVDPGEELLVAPPTPAQIGKGIGDGSPGGPLALGNAAIINDQFRNIAMRELTRAQADALAPLAERIANAAGIADDEARRTACEAIQKDLPTIFKSVSARSGELVTALTRIVGTALLSGATRAAGGR